MTKKDLSKHPAWQLLLVLIPVFVAAWLARSCSSKEDSAMKSTPSVVNNIMNEPAKQPAAIPAKKTRAHSQRESTKITEKYVDVYLNINSNDQVMVNGKPATPDEISDQPNTLKLIAGSRYLIKINNCPEKEIIAAPDMTISVCM